MADPGTRFGAAFVDLVGLIVASFISPPIGTVMYVILYLLTTAFAGGSPGKLIFGLKVVGPEGLQAGPGRVLVREMIGKPISTVFLLLGLLSVALTENRRGWHDMMADTYVFRVMHKQTRASAGPAEVVESQTITRTAAPGPGLRGSPGARASVRPAVTGNQSCPACGIQSLTGASTCQACGEQLSPLPYPMLTCRRCGNILSGANKFCSKCGNQLAVSLDNWGLGPSSEAHHHPPSP